MTNRRPVSGWSANETGMPEGIPGMQPVILKETAERQKPAH